MYITGQVHYMCAYGESIWLFRKENVFTDFTFSSSNPLIALFESSHVDRDEIITFRYLQTKEM